MSENTEEQKEIEKKSASTGLIIGLVTVIMVVAIAITYALASGKVDLEKLFEEPPPPPVVMLEDATFKPLERFVVSINDGYQRNFMVLEITVVSRDPRMPKRVDSMASLMKNTLLKYFSGLDMDMVNQKLANIQQLQIDLRHAFIDAAESYGRTLPIEEVLLTNVVIQ